MFKLKTRSSFVAGGLKLPIYFLFLFLPLVAFAQSIVWQTEIAGQTRTVQSRDDRVRLVVPDLSIMQWQPGQVLAIGKVIKADRGRVDVLLAAGKSLRDALESAPALGVSQVAPIFIEQRDAAGLNRPDLREYMLTPKILVEADSEYSARRAVAASGALSCYPTIARDRWMLVFPNARAVIDGYAALKRADIKAQPQFSMPAHKKAAPNDPLYPQQWHLKNTGQGQGVAGVDVNIEPVWAAGNRGAGQVIAIIDDGLEITHPDLMTNALPIGGDFQTSNHWNFNANPPNNNPGDLNRMGAEPDSHGTNCGGVAAARQNNALGVSGSGPEAGLIGLRLIAGNFNDEDAAAALGWRPALVTISSNSWGFDTDTGTIAGGPDVLARAALQAGVTQGRAGKGIIYTVAGGNRNDRDESNYDSFANSVFVIGVGGNSDKGLQNFSETGCNLLLTAPTGGEGNDQNITTTTLTGLGNVPGSPDYANDFNGTSSATPLVSGVIATILSRNPQLGWRDVKEILLRSARKIDDANGGYQTNGAGLPFRFSNRYGAGMVDANAAATLAQGWTNLGPQVNVNKDSGAPGIAIPDNNATGAVRTFDFAGTNMRVEFVQFTVDITHPFRGELEYTLTSPSGMKAVVNRRAIDNTANLQWTFGDSQHWGEQSNGMWTLEVRDRVAGNTGTFNSASVRIFGTSATNPTPTPGVSPTPGVTPNPSATPTPTPSATPSGGRLGNLSTRLQVGTGSRVMIAGIIVQGNAPKQVLIRAAGPSLTQFGVPNALANPRLELHDATSTIGTNNDWQTTQIGGVITADQVAAIQGSGLSPRDPLESAIIATLAPGNYTAIVEGVNAGTGVGIVEAFDLTPTGGSILGNIATRGFVQTGNDAMIGGFIVVTQPTKVLIRAIGPSLTQFGVPDALANPQLELHDANSTIAQNNDWQTTQLGGIITSDQVAAIQGSGLPPTNPAESAIIATLAPGSYTAIVRGVNNTTGNALVEVYALGTTGSPSPTPAGSPTPTPAGSPSPTPAGSPTPTPAAPPKLFIANGGNQTITTSNIDGTGGTALGGNISPLLMAPQGVAINAAAGKIYAGNEGGNSITQANLDGSGAVNHTLNALLNGPYGVALDVTGNKMYVANGGGGITGNMGFVVRADLDGTNATRLTNLDAFLTNHVFPQGMAINVAGNKMYIAVQNGAIIRADLDGSNPTAHTFGGLLTGTTPLDVAINVTGNRIYVVDFNGKLFTADLDGNNGADLGNLGGTLNAPRGMGLDITGNKMYIGNSGNNTVTQADLPNGANPVALTITTLNSPAVVAVYRAP